MANLKTFDAVVAVVCILVMPAIVTAEWGEWGPVAYCPNGEAAVAFQLKTEGAQGDGDDTALNGVSLQCSGGQWITSTEGP